MENATYTPYIRVAMDNMIEAPWFLDRVIWDYELLYVKEGCMHVTIDGLVYEGLPGDVFLLKPGRRHILQLMEGCTRLHQPHVHFDLHQYPDRHETTISFKRLEEMNAEELDRFRPDELSAAPWQLPDHIRLSQPGIWERLLYELIREFEAKLPFYEWRMNGCLLELLALLAREQHWISRMHPGQHTQTLMELRSFLERNVHRPVSLDELSRRFHLSKYYLVNLFKEQFGQSPIHYHQIIRIERAKNLILYSTSTLSAIADQLGFSSIHAFSRAFKTVDGRRPSEYRQTNT